MKILNSQELQEKIDSGEKFIVDMYADWCGPCRMLSKVIDNVDKKLTEENHSVNIYKFNIESDKDMSVKLGVRSIPVLLAFNEDKNVQTKIGLVQENVIVEMANSIL